MKTTIWNTETDSRDPEWIGCTKSKGWMTLGTLFTNAAFLTLWLSTILVIPLDAQCDTRVSSVLTYCHSFHNGNPVDGYFVAFRVADPTGDTLNVVDLTGQVPTNQGKRIDDINTEGEPPNYSIQALMISGVGADTLEYWYFGPFSNGSDFDIALVDPDNICDTIFVAAGTFDCADMPESNTDPGACTEDVPLYFLDFSNTAFDLGGGGGVNENVDAVFLIMKRPRESTCCDLGGPNIRCIELIVRLAEDDLGILIDDVGNGSTGGEIYADSLNDFSCTGNTNDTYPFQQAGGQSADDPLCLPPSLARDFIILSCKSGNNETGLSVGVISGILVPPVITMDNCTVPLRVFHVDTADWSSPDDPDLNNLVSCTGDSIYCSFHYNEAVFGPVTSCDGDTFTYYVGGIPPFGACLPGDSLLYDTTYVIVYPSFHVELDTMCSDSLDSLVLTANIITSAPGCNYVYHWSTGDTTQTITVPFTPTAYGVTVTRPDLPSSLMMCNEASDSIIAFQAYIDCHRIPDSFLECISALPPPDTGLVIIEGCVITALLYTRDVSNGASACQTDTLVITRHYILDFDGDTVSTILDRDTCSQLFTYVDDQAPVAVENCQRDTALICGSSDLSFIVPPDYIDNCTEVSAIQVSSVLDTLSGFDGTCQNDITGTLQITWFAADTCGNVNGSCHYLIYFIDTLPPLILCPPDLTVDCSSETGPAETGLATATDNCDASPGIQWNDVITEGECPQDFVILRRWIATDACLNRDTCYQSITVQDTVRPVMTCPADTIIDCSTGTSPATTGTATVTDNCDGAPIVTWSDMTVAGACPQEYVITRQWIGMDACQHTDTCYQTIIVQDTAGPVMICPADITIQYSENTLPVNTGFAIAWDNCDAEVLITYTDSVPGTPCPPENFILRTWMAVDDCGHESSCRQYILIDDHGTICGEVLDDLGNPLSGVGIQLFADLNSNGMHDSGDTLVTIQYSDSSTGQYCYQDIPPCAYVLVEIQPLTYGDLLDYDLTPDPDGNDSLDGPDNEIPVILSPMESDTSNTFVDILCPTQLPVIEPDTICENETITFQFEGYNLGQLTYSWDFGSGSTPSTGMGLGPHVVSYVTTTENQSGGAVIELTISKAGCPDVTGQVSSVEVNVFPDPAISTGTSPICYYTNKVFIPAQPEIEGASYLWNFGAGAVPATGMGYGPHIVYYTTTGSKTAKLVIYPNEAGAQCPDSSMITFSIQNCPAQIVGNVKSITNAPIPSVNLKLYVDADTNGLADNSTIIRNVFTTVTGSYSMASVTPGSYVIVQTQPAGWTSFDDFDLSDDGDIVDNIDSLDNLIPVTLFPLEIDSFNTFVESPSPGGITGTVFTDLDNDQVPDTFEGLEGISVSLFADANTDGIADSATPIAVLMTDALGQFNFANIPVGHYVITEAQPAGYISIKDIDASNDGDIVPNTNIFNDTIPVTINNGEVDAHNYFFDFAECTSTISNTHDSGLGSLRHAVECASIGDTIRFHPILAGMTITVNSEKIAIPSDIVVICEISPKVTIASQVNGLFDVLSNTTVQFRECEIISGLSPGNTGAAFENQGTLILHNTHVYRNPNFSSGEYLIHNKINSQLFISGNSILDMN